MTGPDQIRRDIERTRAELSNNVDALTDKVSPGRVVGRRIDRARGVLRTAKEKTMGSVDDAGGAVHRAGSSVGDHVSSAASSVGDAAGAAPGALRDRAKGSPLATGLVAFGIGVVVSALLPPSQREKELAGQVKDTLSEHADGIRQEVSGMAAEGRDNLSGPASEAVDSVKSTAGDSASTVRDEGRSAVYDVRDQARESTHHVGGR